MPRLSDSMESGLVGRWLRADGETVTRGEPIVEVETDKSTVEVAAEASGVLVIRVREGESVATGGAIADIVADGEAAPGPVPDRVAATPLARRLAAEAGIGLASLAPGSGPLGRVHRVDVERRLQEGHEASGDEVVVPGSVQRITAERLTASKREIPHYYVTIEVDATACLALTAGLTDLLVFAAARSLRALPSSTPLGRTARSSVVRT